MTTLYFILLLLSAVTFLAAAFARPSTPLRVDLIALGLLFWVLVPLIQMMRLL
jgi:hypothetical protein